MDKKLLYILMCLAMIAWGETWISAKILGRYLDADELIFWRFFFTTLGLVPILLYYKIPFRISKTNLALAFIAGIVLAFYNNFFFLGTKYGLASFGGVLVTTLVPIVTFIMVSFLNKKSFTLKEFFGLILGAIGVLIILKIWNFNLNTIFSKANIYFLIAIILWPILTIISSKQKEISPLTFSFYMFGATTILDLFFLEFNVNNITSLDVLFWSNLLLLSLYGTTFATTIYFIAVTKLGSKSASSFFFLVPLSTIIFAFIFLDEQIELSLILGGILTIVSVYILNNSKAKS